MSHQIRSMPPPLIPLSSPAKECDPKDPFDSLFSDPGPSKPLFVSPGSTDCMEQGKLPPTPSSSSSEFGAFVSVPPYMDPLQNDAPSPHSEAPASSGFFERFTVEARERAGKNERRVLDEFLQHEDNPLYWLTLQEDTLAADSGRLIGVDELAPLSSPPLNTMPCEIAPHPFPGESPSNPPLARRSSASSLSSNFTSTISRRWVPSLLSNSTHSAASTITHDLATSPPHSTGTPCDSASSLTHSSPFAAHVYVAPSGAPGFVDDRHWNNGGFEFEIEDKKPRTIDLTGRREGTIPVLTNDLANQLRPSLPALPRLAKSWSLLYSLDQHGVSLQTFYARCATLRTGGSTLIVIRDSEERTFGVWMGEQVRMVPGAYYGSGESFLWRSAPDRGHELVEVFKWTGKNEYVALCEPAFLSFGGGEGRYGLYLDANFVDGSSACCPTFDNEVLCDITGYNGSKTVRFECVGLEAWALA